ncbi:hypothetical protein POM88_002587 [Heracleum sosnowskyi]|uniref:Uncharacterized protein n=1 Tax=Heracleum sosnowskyi TaxID=360622 RepID=A0AAD8JEP0_9APIA|nr:hypothetical protein POM88_002587 [Heracleum sosnowskyi]
MSARDISSKFLLSQKNRILQAPLSVVAENAVVHEPLASPAKELDEYRARQTAALAEGTGKDPVSSFKGNKDFRLWQGHEVNSEFVCLLDRIMDKYPETFEHLTPKNKNLCTMNLNLLCTSLNDFTKLSMTEVNSEHSLKFIHKSSHTRFIPCLTKKVAGLVAMN